MTAIVTLVGDVPVKDMLEHPRLRKPQISVRFIQEFVSANMGYTADDLVGRSQRRALTWVRMIAVYFCREFTKESWAYLGIRFGGRDHSTMIHAAARISGIIQHNEGARIHIEMLRRYLYQYAAGQRGPECTKCGGAEIIACPSGQEYATAPCPECRDDGED